MTLVRADLSKYGFYPKFIHKAVRGESSMIGQFKNKFKLRSLVCVWLQLIGEQNMIIRWK